MEIGNQIKKYRSELNLTQEQLAEKVYVSRQTVSNWETGKNYPDIHSLLMLSNLFNISLDELIKGDVEIMKKEINQEEIRKFNSISNVFSILFILCIVTPIPLVKFLDWIGLVIWSVLWIVAVFFAFKVEKIKKENDIQTYKEIVSFMKGEKLDKISKYREEGKRNYQKVIVGVCCTIIGLILGIICKRLML